MAKLIAFDLDDTALAVDRGFSEDGIKVLEEALQRGILIASVSGRNVDRSSSPFNDKLQLFERIYIVSYNGAVVLEPVDRNARELIYVQRMTEDKMLDLTDYVRDNGYDLVYYQFEMDGNGRMDEKLIVLRPSPSTRILETQTGATYEFDEGLTDRIMNKKLGPPPKMMVLPGEENRDRVFDELKDRYKDSLYIAKTHTDRLELMHPDVSKKAAVESICQRNGLSMKDAMAIGDGDNDLPMILSAGIGVLMENAADEVKRAVEGTNVRMAPLYDEDGFARAVRKFAFNSS